MKKKGLSPVVATVLLIAIVIVIGLIVFLWFKGTVSEAVTKFGGKNIQLVCEDVSFDADYSGGNIYLSNSGNVPIYQIKAKISSGGSHSTHIIGEGDPDWPAEGLNQGGAYSGPLGTTVSSGDEILLIPVLVGVTESEGEKSHTCDDRHGYKLLVK